MDIGIAESLVAARNELREAIALSGQGSYARRSPAAISKAGFSRANDLLASILVKDPLHREALLLYSQERECVLDYGSAIKALDEAFLAGEPRSRQHLKRRARLVESLSTWQTLQLTPEQLQELGEFLQDSGVDASSVTMERTTTWLRDHNVPHHERVLQGLQRMGAYSDFQVLANVVFG